MARLRYCTECRSMQDADVGGPAGRNGFKCGPCGGVSEKKTRGPGVVWKAGDATRSHNT